MRHARMRQARMPSALGWPALRDEKDDSASADITGAGRALAETLDGMKRAGHGCRQLRFLYEKCSPAAKLTCATLRSAYENARAGEHRCAPESEAIDELDVDPVSPHRFVDPDCNTSDTKDVEQWLCDVQEKLAPPPDTSSDGVAVVVVGHDPRMGWLLGHLIGRRTRVPGLSHTELIACYRKGETWKYRAAWALSPTDSALEEAVRGKVKSKMDTAKVFAAVLAAVISFVADSTLDLRGGRRATALFGLASLGLATTLYLVTMFWYDRLLMPPRFWATQLPPSLGSKLGTLRWWLSRIPRPFPMLHRPPSNATWVLYQNMQLVWSRCFLPATVVAGIGVVLFVVAVAGPDSFGEWRNLALVAAVFLIVAVGVARWSRPNLGVQD